VSINGTLFTRRWHIRVWSAEKEKLCRLLLKQQITFLKELDENGISYEFQDGILEELLNIVILV